VTACVSAPRALKTVCARALDWGFWAALNFTVRARRYAHCRIYAP
jgi:hypothetical protein